MLNNAFDKERDWMTDEIYERDWISEDNYIYEIATGKNLQGYDVFSLTVLEAIGERIKCWHNFDTISLNIQDIRKTIKLLKGERI